MMLGRSWLNLLALVSALALIGVSGAGEDDGNKDQPSSDGEEGDPGDVEWGEESGPPADDDDSAEGEIPTPEEGEEGATPAGDEGEGDEAGTDAEETGDQLPPPDEDDVDNWDTTIEKQDLNQVKEREEVKVDVEAEPERIGISGNWYQVGVDCLYCETILGQNLDVQEPEVMRQFFDHLQIEPDARMGKLVYPSEGINRPLIVTQDEDRVIVLMYVIDVGDRTTPLYATIWDFRWLLRDQKLLYGRRYSIDAYQPFAYADWEKGYKADESFLPQEQIRTFLDLSPVMALDETEKRFPIGDKAMLTYLGSDAFVRSDFDIEPYEDLQARLFKERTEAEERERERVASMEAAEEQFDDREYETCLASLQRASELGEVSADLHFYMGAAYQGLKQYEQAIEQYGKVLEITPKDTSTRFNMAMVLEKLGRYKDALREYQVILKWDPDDEEAKERAFNLALQLQGI